MMQSWNHAGWNATLRESRYGDFCSFTLLVNTAEGPKPLDDQIYDARWLADFELSYKWREATIAIGVENMFDQFPTENLARNSTGAFTPQGNFGIFTYPSHSPFGMNGRFVYTRVGYSF
jgi:iron complex outermembrane receptor protein